EQVVAPINESLQSLVARQGGAAARGEQTKLLMRREPRRDLLDPQRFHPGGSELQREWDAIELVADLGDSESIVDSQRKTRQGGLRTLDEQPYRFILGEGLECRLWRIRSGEGRDEIKRL